MADAKASLPSSELQQALLSFLPGIELLWAQPIACQNPFVQSPEFLNDQGLHIKVAQKQEPASLLHVECR